MSKHVDVGCLVGSSVVGTIVGDSVGTIVGDGVDTIVGDGVGAIVGDGVGVPDGVALGLLDGAGDGTSTGRDFTPVRRRSVRSIMYIMRDDMSDGRVLSECWTK
jgi:hypothetical protein